MARFHLYVGTYTQKGGTGIEHYAFDNETGGFALLDAAPAPNPSYLALSPDGQTLYACLEAPLYEGMGGVAAFRRAQDGSLREIGRQSAGGGAPCHVLVHPSGRTLYVANYGSGSLTQFALEADGNLGQRMVFAHHGHSVIPVRQEGPHAHCAALMPGGRTLCVVDLGLDAILRYPLDEAGRVTGEPARTAAPAGSGPRHMVFSPDGSRAYAVCELGNRILTYQVEGGELTLIGDASTLPEDYQGFSSCAALRLTGDGKRLYLTNRFHDTLAQFDADGQGGIECAGWTPTGGKNPRDCALAPGEGFILCAHQDSDEVTILKLDPATGRASLTPTAIGASMPVAVLFGGPVS